MAATGEKLDPNKVYECRCACLTGPRAAATQEGEELYGSDERIQWLGDDWSRYFVEAGTPKGVGVNSLDVPVEATEAKERAAEEERRAAFERAAKANAVKLEAPAFVKATRDIVGELDGQPATVKRGSALAADHPFVEANQDSFA